MTVNPNPTGYGANSPSRFKTTEPTFDDSDEDEEGADESGEASEKIGALRRPLGMQPIKLSRTNTLPSPTARAPMTPQLQPTRSLQVSRSVKKFEMSVCHGFSRRCGDRRLRIKRINCRGAVVTTRAPIAFRAARFSFKAK
jgi:hypothetical protein